MGKLVQNTIAKRARRRFNMDLIRDARGPIVVTAAIALAEQAVHAWPGIPEPAPLILVAVAILGFLSNVNSAVLSSLIAVTYGLIFVPERHDLHGNRFDLCLEGITLAIGAPLLAITGAFIRRSAERSAETLRKHLSNTPLGVIELNENYEICQWAGAASSIFGISPQAAIGANLFDLPHIFFRPEDAGDVQSLLNELELGLTNRAVHHTRMEAFDGRPGHSRWFWSTTLDVKGGRSRYLVLVEDITDRVRAEEQLEASRTELIERLVRATELRDEDTGAHIVRMARYCEALAKAIDMDETERRMLLLAAPMHDIGKLGVPDEILKKDGKLQPEEFAAIKEHTTIGANILSGSQSELVQMAEKIALTHHERWDGTGYPNGLREKEIPMVGRICAVCDVFDALTSRRSYKEGWSLIEAANELKQLAGTHFDPDLVEAFLTILPEIEAIRQQYDEFAPQGSRRAA